MAKVQIVITAVNLWNSFTKPCIDSIKTKHEYRILLIDNGSTDETKLEAGKLVSTTFSHKRNDEQWSCSKSWNWGVKDAFERGYDYVMILNNDVLLHPLAIDNLIERMSKDDVVLASCLNLRGQLGRPSDLFSSAIPDSSIPEAPHPDFSGFMVTRMHWDKVGYFDEDYNPAYFEDNSYHRRIKLLGEKAICYPQAPYYHFGSQTTNQSKDFSRAIAMNFERNREVYMRMWGGVPDHETFNNPFNRPELSCKKTKNGLEFDMI
jgi:GT2 family glycosyltransferase